MKADPAVLQLVVITTEGGSGDIEEAGGGEVAGVVRFDLSLVGTSPGTARPTC